MNNITVECKRVKFYSPFDEDAFFEWIKKIKSIKDVKGKLDKIILFFKTDELKQDELDNLVALFRRYKINLKLLHQFVSKKNKEDYEYFKDCYHINMYPNRDSNE
jgi:hypothetical protein